MQGSSLRALGGDAARLTLLARWAAAPLVAAARRLRGLRGARRLDRVEVPLADWQTWSTRAGKRGATVRCTEGLLWVTQEGDREDHLLKAGEELRLARAGLLVLVALGPSRGVVAGERGLPDVQTLLRWPIEKYGGCAGGRPNPRAPPPVPPTIVRTLPDGTKIIDAGAKGCVRAIEEPCRRPPGTSGCGS